MIPSTDPFGREMYWFSPKPLGGPEPGTDRNAVEADLVSITPLRLDLTDERTLASLVVPRAKS